MSRTTFPLTAIPLLLGILFGTPLAAQFSGLVGENADDPIPAPEKIVIYPRKQSDRALEHRLLPGIKDLIDEDGAGYYLKAMMFQAESLEYDKQNIRADELLDLPPDKFDLDDAHNILQAQSDALKHLHLAAKRKYCNWPLPWREEHLNIYGLQLPELTKIRNLMRLVWLEARVALAEDRLTDAFASIQTGYAAARHLSATPLMINGLVGIAMANMMHDELLRVMQHPACPNLYWSLTALPQPLLDFRASMEFEGDMLFIMFPEFEKIDQQRTSQEWNQMYMQMTMRRVKLFDQIGLNPRKSNNQNTLYSLFSEPFMIAVITPYLHSKAKVGLTKRGYDKKTIDAMPMCQAIMLEIVRGYQHHRDEMLKWQNLPVNEWPSQQTLSRHEREALDSELSLYAGGLLPSMRAVRMSFLRLERHTNLLRAVEALRMHAAQTGRLPQEWQEVTVVPVPRDPLTGEPFRYKLSGETALLEALDPEQNVDRNYQFEIRLAKPGEVYVKPPAPVPPPVAVKKTPPKSLAAWMDDLNPFVQMRQSAERSQSMDNLKSLALAMHNYHDAYKHFPPAASVDAKTGKPLLSWRVQLLPYLGEKQLYEQFHQDEPWDSDHNKKLLDKMPAVYASPRRANVPANHTVYLVPTGETTIFRDATGITFRQVADGTSKTILGFEAPAAIAVPWTKPEDWAFDPKAKDPLLNLFEAGASEVLTMFADGSARVIPRDADPEAVKAALTAAGGETVGLP